MHELEDSSVHLVVTSPPYLDAPFDYPDLFDSYAKNPARELKRVLDEGRVAAFYLAYPAEACVPVSAVSSKTHIGAQLDAKGLSFRERDIGSLRRCQAKGASQMIYNCAHSSSIRHGTEHKSAYAKLSF